MLHQKTEKAGTELCQAQSKLIQIGRVVRKKIEVEKNICLENIMGRKILWVEYIFCSKNVLG